MNYYKAMKLINKLLKLVNNEQSFKNRVSWKSKLHQILRELEEAQC